MMLYSDANAELAQLYLDEAFLNYQYEEFESAEYNLIVSLSFSETLSKAWYLSGLMFERKGNRLKALEKYKHSLEVADVYEDHYKDLLYQYVSLLKITGQNEEVLYFYKNNKKLMDLDNRILLIVSDAAYDSGFIDISTELAFNVYKSNPDNFKALMYMLRSSNDSGYYHFLKSNMSHFIKDSVDEVIFQEYILSSRNEKKKELIGLYKDLFGETPFYYSFINMVDPSIEKSPNLLIRSSGSDTLENGVYWGDYNYDGVSDEIISVSDDDITYMRDKNQDNITDVSINYHKGIPENIFINREGITYEFRYSQYPLVDEIHYNSPYIKRVYKILPGVDFSPLKNIEEFNWKYDSDRSYLSQDFSLTPVDLLQFSYSFNEIKIGNSNVFRQYNVKNGEIYQIKEDSDLNGTFDHFLEISAWNSVSGSRDINDDDKIDIYEYYDSGKLIGIAVDWDNNGKAEYLEDWSLLNLKTWDFNQDSYYDAESISSSDSNEYHQVSIEKEPVAKNDIYSWDFSDDKFWFIK
jgi:hypothetical protein